MKKTDRKAEYKEFEDCVSFDKKIADFSQERAVFILIVLLASGAISESAIKASMDLANSVSVY